MRVLDLSYLKHLVNKHDNKILAVILCTIIIILVKASGFSSYDIWWVLEGFFYESSDANITVDENVMN